MPEILAQRLAQVLLVDAGPRERGVERRWRRRTAPHPLDLAIHRLGGRLGRRVAIDFGQHQLAIDQLVEHGAHRIGGAVRRLQTESRRRGHSLNVISCPATTASTRSIVSARKRGTPSARRERVASATVRRRHLTIRNLQIC